MEVEMVQQQAQQGPDYTLLILSVVYNIILYAICTISIFMIARKTGFQSNAWFAFVPILNLLLLLDIAEKPKWWVAFTAAPLILIVTAFHLVGWVTVTIELVKPGETPTIVFIQLIGLAIVVLLSLIGLVLFVLASMEISKKRGMGAGWGVLMGAFPFVGLPVTAFAEPLPKAT